jgi:signal transduction histidine kinase
VLAPSDIPRHQLGTGLGLDTARRIVEDRHAGSIAFETGERGTTFHVWIPFENRNPPATETAT